MTNKLQRPFRFAAQVYRANTGQEWRDVARRVEDMGYSALHVSDHYIGPGAALDPTGHRPVTMAPVASMAVAAEVTNTLKVGCRMFCASYHEPVVLAKEVATLAMFAPDRIEVGLGAGWLGAEYEAMGIDFPSAGMRVDRLEETVELITQYLAGAAIDVDGKFVKARDFVPLPVPEVTPPIMIGGGARRVLTLAGKTADIVSINFNNRSGVLGSDSVATSTVDETHKKLAWVRDGAGDRFPDIELETGAYFVAIDGATDVTEQSLLDRTGFSRDELRAFPHALVGTVDNICDQLEQRRDEFGFSYFTIGDRAYEQFAPVVERMTGK
ncbi:oxidoreductase [Rhodococcus sp. Leaf7]|uniref:TIGR03621 family F420-dependent LLM class oxidoreductase n=1 Tax=unclassified Rhodococcus (in: high G+C Gram-positive bacteria) TaxID=192944 RepID=UPI0006F6B4F3|nr:MULTISPECIES: TIGR03621 family F420-dependent LLM class oxidoreductase [unclassified Rhodococcus (in: high G+C Gram-positive bacteria)]KQU07167.1 oxidoreductase [Rhodococcus sp. Leaf7]KQU42685.1 oxidoreductase [Rhodococcus sp. Leaf247]